MEKNFPHPLDGNLRKFSLRVPACIRECSGILIFGRRIKSMVFSTDLSIIRNTNADAVMAVYPFTPQPVIAQALLQASDLPVFAGVGGGLTQGRRIVNLALFAEMQGAIGVVVNAPATNDVIRDIYENLDIPIIVTVVNESKDIEARIHAGAAILNVSAAADTPRIIEKIRKDHPDIPIIATGGPSDQTITDTINAGANAITWTPPSTSEIFKSIMAAYRRDEPHP